MTVTSIFVVDDDPIVLYGIKKLLYKVNKNMEVLTFHNGEEAIKAVRYLRNTSYLPDIIFLDINMPIMDGWEFLEELMKLKIKKKININIVSSTIDPQDLGKIERYKKTKKHRIEFNNKPITSKEIERITKAA